MPKKAKRIKNIDAVSYGTEPVLKQEVVTTGDLIGAYNWYSALYDNEKAKQFVIDYLKSIKFDKKKLKAINQIPAIKLRNAGWNFRQLTIGGNIPQALLDKNWNVINTEIEQLSKIPETETETVEPNRVSPQSKIREYTGNHIAEIEGSIDDMLWNNTEFDISAYLRDKEIKGAIAIKIADHFKPMYSEIFDVLNTKDSDLKFAYSHMKKPVIKKYLDYLKEIIAACEARNAAVKIIRKPRKKKEKPAAVLVAKLKYLDKYEGFESIKPQEVVGAQQLWVFNTKYRTLGVFNAMSHVGLSVKGTTILGYDEKTSIAKKVRKPDVILPRVKDGGKIILRKVMDEINAKPKTLKGRINGDVLLLRMVK